MSLVTDQLVEYVVTVKEECDGVCCVEWLLWVSQVVRGRVDAFVVYTKFVLMFILIPDCITHFLRESDLLHFREEFL